MAASVCPPTQTIAETLSDTQPQTRHLDSLSHANGGEDFGMPGLKDMSQSPDRNSDSVPDLNTTVLDSQAMQEEEVDTKASQQCEVCGIRFETRRGLSSHARSHLRQLGVGISESSGAPIDLLYQLAREWAQDGRPMPVLTPNPPPKKLHRRKSASHKLAGGSAPLSPLEVYASGHSPSPPILERPRSPSPQLKRSPVSSLLPASSPLRKPTARKATPTSGPHSSKPIWAPQDTDAPISLNVDSDSSKVTCQLCGAWFGSRKGLSSHARAHLRHLGVINAEAKGSPIATLNKLIHTEDFQRRLADMHPDEAEELLGVSSSPAPPSGSTSSSSSKRLLASAAGRVRSTPSKRMKAPAVEMPAPVLQMNGDELMPLSHGEVTKGVTCELCGEYFENRKGLSSHARSHLRQMGIRVWTVNGSPIDTLADVVARRGLSFALAPSPPASPGPPSSASTSPVSPVSNKQPRVPLARKPPLTVKMEPVQLACGAGEEAEDYSPTQLQESWEGSDGQPSLSLDLEPSRDIRCEFCGEYFENRKGLSSHARSHLRQLGVTEWSVNGSPIDTLREVMREKSLHLLDSMKEEAGSLWDEPLLGPQDSPRPKHKHNKKASTGEHKVYSPSLHKSSPKGKFSPEKLASGFTASCQLCGFCFENRKALASHARAHLRQIGVTQWCVNGSPIQTLSAWMRSQPQKVAEIHRRHLLGGKPFGKKRRKFGSHPSLGSGSGHAFSTQKVPLSQRSSVLLSLARRAGRGMSASSQPPEGRGVHGKAPVHHARGPARLLHSQVAHSELNVRSPRVFERRTTKHLPHSEGGRRETAPQTPRSGAVPALVPKPPPTPLVKVVGNVYSLKCRFCDLEFRGPLSVQEDWVRHLQRHILDLNFNKPDPPAAAAAGASKPPTPLTATPVPPPPPVTTETGPEDATQDTGLGQSHTPVPITAEAV